MVMFVKNNLTISRLGEVILGFGILFMGISGISGALNEAKEIPAVVNALGSLTNPFLAFLVGWVATAILQSNSATVGIIMLLAREGLMGLPICLFMMLGCNLSLIHIFVGKDTILEEGRRLYEVLDLGYGKCRMCVCGPESARELLQHNQQIRVATKYPNIAKDYFYNRKHQTVEMIKLNGSIELAPIVGLSEVIVDIVETGSTLRENGLTVLEEVCPLSARMVVNQVSMRMENERITKLIQDLKGALV